ncbi:MAG: hydrogenase expression/formation protein [Chromatiales bacterium]|nr:hydrogenase expression/formation protein [Chromatiales bacterium]
MPKPIDIPVIGIGPGSQPEEGEALAYLEMPKGMFRHEVVSLPEKDELADLPQLRELLERLYTAIAGYRAGDPAIPLELEGLEPRMVEFVNQILGEGEVSVSVEAPGLHVQAQESVLTGLWRVRRLDERRRPVREWLEVADIPAAVRDASFSGDKTVDTGLEAIPEGVHNAPALLVEIADKIREWRPGMEPHVINLSLLPLTAQDLVFLGERLGVGPTTILSRGYGNCRIGATAKDNLWWIKYYNSQDALILNTIEVVDVPAVAMAAPEDIEDSTERLKEILEQYR